MDYDQTEMAAAYDKGRTMDADEMVKWLDACVERVPSAQTIIDLGCGTGRFCQPLADRYGAAVIGIDPSHTMLAEAAAKTFSDSVSFRHGAAEAIPMDDASADLVFSSMAFHHFTDPDQAARECRRVLREGGSVLVRNSTQERSRTSPYAPFFEGFLEIVDAHLPPADAITAAFVGAGFELASHALIPHRMARDWETLAAKAEHKADSLLSRLDDAAFRAGLAAMRRAAPVPFVGHVIDFFHFRAA